MPKRSDVLFLFDIFVAILKIEYVVNRYDDAEKLKYNFISWYSVIRKFEIKSGKYEINCKHFW